MKINEVEQKAGISKKNIRFYEAQGLLMPRRNAETGYREYTQEEVQILLRIKLLRKLGVPIEEIRQMLSGTHTVADSMRRHMISLEREQRNLEQSMELCREMQTWDISAAALNAEEILARMEQMEQGGTTFQNKQTGDIRVRYIAPVVVTVLTVLFMAAMSGLLLWGYRLDPENAPPVWFLWVLIGLFASVCIGTILALIQRITEIGKGEIDDARRY